jgi:hypothetical protein
VILFATVYGESQNELNHQICSALEGMKIRGESLIAIVPAETLISDRKRSDGRFPMQKSITIFYEGKS